MVFPEKIDRPWLVMMDSHNTNYTLNHLFSKIDEDCNYSNHFIGGLRRFGSIREDELGVFQYITSDVDHGRFNIFTKRCLIKDLYYNGDKIHFNIISYIREDGLAFIPPIPKHLGLNPTYILRVEE